MTSKKNGSKKLFDDMPVEPEQPRTETPNAQELHEQRETESPETNQIDRPVVSNMDAPAEEQAEPKNDDASTDDLLEDVRRSLLEEEEEHEKEAKTKWWKRIGRKSRKNTAPLEPAQVIEETDLPNSAMDETIVEPKPEPEPKTETDELDDLIDLLAAEQPTSDKQAASPESTPPTPEPEPEPEKVPDIEELKKQAFEPRPSSVQEEDLTEVRSIALEGEEEVFVEVQSTPQDPFEERLKAVENAFKPYQRYVNFALAFLGLLMAVIAGMILFNIYKQTAAANAPTPVPSNIPFPTSVSLPGGWTFKLGKGSLVDGKWEPAGAEWLQGTEVCRWVALPWSRQLEAVVRTLNPDDPIQLGMSNNDVLTYKVYSIKQMSPEEMQKLDSNTPCLLVVLVEPKAEKRWVLTSLP